MAMVSLSDVSEGENRLKAGQDSQLPPFLDKTKAGKFYTLASTLCSELVCVKDSGEYELGTRKRGLENLYFNPTLALSRHRKVS